MNLVKSVTSFLILVFALLFVVGSIPVSAEVKEAPTRNQIEDKYKWDRTDPICICLRPATRSKTNTNGI